jgi:hypothetical protein
MKQTVLRYGLYSGAIASALMVSTTLYFNAIGNTGYGTFVGYTGILLSMLFVYFGVRSYRDRVEGGALSFSKGLQVGLLIALVSCVCYVLAWMVVYETIMPDFMDNYIRQALAQMQAQGLSETEIAAKAAEMEKLREMYKNPLWRFALTFLEPFPVGFGAALVSAAILGKRG